eukprot:TRINITY_DN7546_c1_g1_i1.p1 TRINITY_DN7546_c1_g1~~TRINITY_DN7546_c1_g1_i1.p1  ORF type:complete len:209 (-),score=-4.53 TRINITY_DN7546_c1_g1_i1:46-672(-)
MEIKLSNLQHYLYLQLSTYFCHNKDFKQLLLKYLQIGVSLNIGIIGSTKLINLRLVRKIIKLDVIFYQKCLPYQLNQLPPLALLGGVKIWYTQHLAKFIKSDYQLKEMGINTTEEGRGNRQKSKGLKTYGFKPLSLLQLCWVGSNVATKPISVSEVNILFCEAKCCVLVLSQFRTTLLHKIDRRVLYPRLQQDRNKDPSRTQRLDSYF